MAEILQFPIRNRRTVSKERRAARKKHWDDLREKVMWGPPIEIPNCRCVFTGYQEE